MRAVETAARGWPRGDGRAGMGGQISVGFLDPGAEGAQFVFEGSFHLLGPPGIASQHIAHLPLVHLGQDLVEGRHACFEWNADILKRLILVID